ncbi:MAG: hypothetical protein KDM81_20645, partial [Verrucomicrobiae bacterium]|nr:hypothetical protein [Verrucomicrobiae bacterium]
MNARTHSFRLAAAALALAGSFTLGRAAEDVLWTWDDAQGTWGTAWGQAQTSWDSTQDNTGNGGGSLHIVSDFGTPPAGEEYKQNVITVMGNFGGWVWNGDVRTNLLEFETLEFDLKWDTGNATLAIDAFNNTGGDNGLAVLSARYVATDWDWSVYLSNVLVPEAAADGWQHIVIPINPLTPNLDECAGLMFKKWVPEEISNAGGTAAFWIDNVHLVAKAGEIPPPTMSAPTPATPGLNLLTLAGSQWQRQGIRTVGDNFSWVGSGGPTTYRFSIREVPSADYAGFQTHIFLVARDPRTGAGPDWSQPDVVFLDMQVQGDGSCVATFRYKIDLPDNNG